jgi:hypothetical protein
MSANPRILDGLAVKGLAYSRAKATGGRSATRWLTFPTDSGRPEGLA